MSRARPYRPLPRAAGAWLAAAVLATGACASDNPDERRRPTAPTEFVDLVLSDVSPRHLIPSTKLILTGQFGTAIEAPELVVNAAGKSVGITAKQIDAQTLEATWPGAATFGLPVGVNDVALSVTARGAIDGLTHKSGEIGLQVRIDDSLTPDVGTVETNGAIFVNDLIEIEGVNFLLGQGEGDTYVKVAGCFEPLIGGSCAPVKDHEFIATPVDPTDRSHVAFPFRPIIAGIERGTFRGTLTVENRHADGTTLTATYQPEVTFTLLEPKVFSFSPARASLGQFMNIKGGGFVGTTEDDPKTASTRIELDGEFKPDGATLGIPVNFSVIPEFSSGNVVRYIVNEDDALGKLANLREISGDFTGTAKPIVSYDGVTVEGAPSQVMLGIAPIKQVVWINFLPSYVESLEHLGLRAVDQRVRDRVFASLERIYRGLNVEFRTSEPDDFGLFSRADVGGPDPNGFGLLGYDNTPGKDIDNQRLYDQIGGVNAKTQEDGYAGYGGVFVDSLFAFSAKPGNFATETGNVAPEFDLLFNPFRPDLKGKPVSASEVASGIPEVTPNLCPADGAPRQQQIACAIHAVGSLIGDTLGHEVAHSLGLAQPDGEAFHNEGDAKGRLMDSGANREFNERAQLGAAPGEFCAQNYAYLRRILPSAETDPLPSRPDCF